MSEPYKITEARPLSWSAISSFEYDPEQWYRKYILNEKTIASKEMLFGSDVGQRISSTPEFLPRLSRRSFFEYELRTVFNKIPLIGFIDSYEPHTHLEEYKTGKKVWDQGRADGHGQIDMYLLQLFLMHKVRPEDVQCTVHWLPTQDNGDFSITFTDPPRIHSFRTERTMEDVMKFGQRINRVYKDMQKYVQRKKEGL